MGRPTQRIKINQIRIRHMDLNNTVIPSINAEDGPKIVAFYKKHGYNTYDFIGKSYKKNYNTFYYYGVDNNDFDSYDEHSVKKHKLKVLDISIINETIDIWI